MLLGVLLKEIFNDPRDVEKDDLHYGPDAHHKTNDYARLRRVSNHFPEKPMMDMIKEVVTSVTSATIESLKIQRNTARVWVDVKLHQADVLPLTVMARIDQMFKGNEATSILVGNQFEYQTTGAVVMGSMIGVRAVFNRTIR